MVVDHWPVEAARPHTTERYPSDVDLGHAGAKSCSDVHVDTNLHVGSPLPTHQLAEGGRSTSTGPLGRWQYGRMDHTTLVDLIERAKHNFNASTFALAG